MRERWSESILAMSPGGEGERVRGREGGGEREEGMEGGREGGERERTCGWLYQTGR